MELTPAPEEIRVTADRSAITVQWANAAATDISAAALRAACRCAHCVRDRTIGAAQPATNIRIAAVQPVSHYAVNIAFSDGHDRGIYPWGYLRELAGKT